MRAINLAVSAIQEQLHMSTALLMSVLGHCPFSLASVGEVQRMKNLLPILFGEYAIAPIDSHRGIVSSFDWRRREGTADV